MGITLAVNRCTCTRKSPLSSCYTLSSIKFESNSIGLLQSYSKDSKVRENQSLFKFKNNFVFLFRQGERVRGPHVLECNANINRVKIRQVVHFPNNHDQDFVVESTTKNSDLVALICRELKFHVGSASGLSLYIETDRKRTKIYLFNLRFKLIYF